MAEQSICKPHGSMRYRNNDKGTEDKVLPELYEDRANCCGCSACCAICPVRAIVMEPDEEGFLYPIVDAEKCIRCYRCTSACAFKEDQRIHEYPGGEVVGKRFPKTEVYGGRLRDREKLLASSSGGAFTALSDVFLGRGDAVACSTYNFETHQQEYRIIETAAERNEARGSKYVQSIPGSIFKEIEMWLMRYPNRKLLFVGMGCQSAGFQKYAEMKGFRDRMTVVDIICHGSPSPQIWRKYAEILEKKSGKMSALTFKDKRNGWKSPTPVAVMGGKEYLLREYVKIFYSQKALRLSCHQCPYAAMQRHTDITIGDFWHIEDKRPENYDKDGTSLFLIHTEKGKEIFESAKPALSWFESNISECWQLNLERPTPMDKDREKFWKDYRNHGVEYLIHKYGNDSLVVRATKKAKKIIKRIINKA